MRAPFVLALTAALLTACSGSETQAAGRLIVVGDDGNIAVVNPDGTTEIPLTDDAGPRRVYNQPTWSPDGEQVAWVEIRGDEEPGVFALASTNAQAAPASYIRVAHPNGSDQTTITTPFIPFFLMWDRASERIAFLGNDERGVGFGLADPGTGTAVRVDHGTPYYLAWSPDGERVLAHVGVDRLDGVDLDGAAEPAAIPGRFRSPAWAANGTRAYVVGDGGAQRIVLERSDGGTTAVADVAGFTALVLAPDGERVAYVDTLPPDGSTFGELYVSDSPGPIADDVLAVFWSPDGGRLLYLRHDLTEAPWLRWGVWDGQETVEFDRFQPSAVLATQYLPFFDQYAQSLTFWSPDGTRFVYAGSGESGDAGIWVQPVEAGMSPELVIPGVFAAWSPDG